MGDIIIFKYILQILGILGTSAYFMTIMIKATSLKKLRKMQDENNNPSEFSKNIAREAIYSNLPDSIKATTTPANIEVTRQPNFELDSLVNTRSSAAYILNPFKL